MLFGVADVYPDWGGGGGGGKKTKYYNQDWSLNESNV